MMNTISPTGYKPAVHEQHLIEDPDRTNTSYPEGIRMLSPSEFPSFEKGAGEPFLLPLITNNEVLRERISEGEVFLKQVFGNSYERVSKSFNRIVLPIIPSDYVLMSTEDDGKTEKIVGKGGFGVVFEGTLMFPRGQMKKIVLKENFDRSDQESIADESRICIYLERTGFVPVCYGLVKTDSGVLRMVQERFGNGTTLRKVFKEGLIPKSHHILLLDIACQIAEGLSRIHSMHVLLNDLKSDNILVDLTHTKPYIRFCDFGLSSYKEGIRYVNVNRLSSPHIAPEYAGDSNLPTTAANDVFGLGRILKRIYMITKYEQLAPLVHSLYNYNPNSRCSALESWQYLQMALIDAAQLEQIEKRKQAAKKMNQTQDMVAAGEPAFGRSVSVSKTNKSGKHLNSSKLKKMKKVSNRRKSATLNKAKSSHLNNAETTLTQTADSKERLSVSPQADVKPAPSSKKLSPTTRGETSASGATAQENGRPQNTHRHAPIVHQAQLFSQVARISRGFFVRASLKEYDTARGSGRQTTRFRVIGDFLHGFILHGLVLAFVTLLAMAWIKD